MWEGKQKWKQRERDREGKQVNANKKQELALINNQDVLPRPRVGSNLTPIQKASVLIFMYQSFVTLFT